MKSTIFCIVIVPCSAGSERAPGLRREPDGGSTSRVLMFDTILADRCRFEERPPATRLVIVTPTRRAGAAGTPPPPTGTPRLAHRRGGFTG
ncbi:MAG: hypothetical protein NDJ92_00370 [Thermoanaerobaculia bacterium]|nr:hypothetical protein [Thermoanaerobaculia bacterium]